MGHLPAAELFKCLRLLALHCWGTTSVGLGHRSGGLELHHYLLELCIVLSELLY